MSAANEFALSSALLDSPVNLSALFCDCTDIWSLGCTVIEMLSGTHPWPELGGVYCPAFHIIKAGASGPPRPPQISEEALDFINKCLQWEAAARPAASDLISHPFLNSTEDVTPASATAGTESN